MPLISTKVTGPRPVMLIGEGADARCAPTGRPQTVIAIVKNSRRLRMGPSKSFPLTRPHARNRLMTPSSPDTEVTQLLVAWGRGDAAAGERLLPIVYAELHRRAAAAMRREQVGHTLQTTALVHEAYMRLVSQRETTWRNRAQFYGVAAQVMRRILIDQARERLAEKRGGGARQITLSGIEAPDSDDAVEVL